MISRSKTVRNVSNAMKTNQSIIVNGPSAPEPFLTREPPHWAARGMAYLLTLVFIMLVIASTVIKVPETISAPFVLAPRRGADPVRSLRRGIVQRVNVVEGQTVAQGDKLFIIRSEQIGDQSAELGSFETQIRGARESLSIASDKLRSQQLSAAEERRKLQGRFEHLQRLMELKTGELTTARKMAENYAYLRREGLASATILEDKQVEVSRLTGQLEQLRDDQRETRASLEKLSHDEVLLGNDYRERERQVKEQIETAKIQIAARRQFVER